MFAILFDMVFCLNKNNTAYFFSRANYQFPDDVILRNAEFVKPGVILHFNPIITNVSNPINITYHSKQAARKFFSRRINDIGKENYFSIIKKFKWPKYRCQIIKFNSHEEYKNSNGEVQVPVITNYNGRFFEINVFFVKMKNNGKDYSILYAPLTVSLIAKTFLYKSQTPFQDSKTILFETIKNQKSRSQDQFYTKYGWLSSILKYLYNGKMVTDVPVPLKFDSLQVEKMYHELYDLIEEEKKKFLEIPF